MKIILGVFGSVFLSLFTACLSAYAQDCKTSISVIGADEFCDGKSTTLVARIPPKTNLQWLRNGLPIEKATDSVLLVTQPGDYQVQITQGQEKWEPLSWGGQDNSLNQIQFMAGVGWSVGERGTLLKTNDSGVSWESIPLNRPESILTSVHFINKLEGWIGGKNGLLLRTTDGGGSWQDLKSPIAGSVQKLKFFDSKSGYILAGKHFFKTTDGGSTWINMVIPVDAEIIDFAFPDADYGWVSTKTQIFRTENGGKEWILYRAADTCDAYKIQKIFALSRTLFWAVYTGCDQTTLMFRTRGGVDKLDFSRIACISITPGYCRLKISDLVFVSESIGYATGIVYARENPTHGYLNSAVYRTYDGGQNWHRAYIAPAEEVLSSIAFSSPTKGMIVGYGGQLLNISTETGVSSPYPAKSFLPLNSVAGNKDFVMAVGGKREVRDNNPLSDCQAVQVHTYPTWPAWLKYESAGRTYSQIRFKSEWLGWRVGYGTLENYTYAERDFSDLLRDLKPTEKNFIIERAYFQTKTTGWYLARSADSLNSTASLYRFSGSTRTSYPIVYTDGNEAGASSMLDLQFVNDQAGFITTSNGKLIKTINGGESWTVLTVKANNSFRRCFFLNENLGYLVGQNGNILKTTDGGNSWIAQISGVTTSLNGLWFTNKLIGYAVGDNGVVLKTSDGGQRWVRQPTQTHNNLNDVSFTGNNVGMIAGENGTLLELKYTQCRFLSPPQKIKVNPLPISKIVTNYGTSFCEYSSVMLEAERHETYPYQYNYMWLFNGELYGSWCFPELNARMIGSYSLRVTSEHGCRTISEPLAVTSRPVPLLPTIHLDGGSKLISSASAGNQWLFNGSPIAGATASEYSPQQEGKYSVQVTVDGCTSKAYEPFQFVITGNEPAGSTSIVIFPNPVQEDLRVSLSNLTGLTKFELFSTSGNRLVEKQVNISNQNDTISFKLAGLSPGLYTMVIKNADLVFTRKVLINP